PRTTKVDRHPHAPRPPRSRNGITRRPTECIPGIDANGSSTTQSISAPGCLRATSLTAGQWCTTSPSDEVLTKRTLSVGQSHLEWSAAVVGDNPGQEL